MHSLFALVCGEDLDPAAFYSRTTRHKQLSGVMGIFSRVYHAYDSRLRLFPVRTKMATAVVLSFIGDSTAQLFERKNLVRSGTGDAAGEAAGESAGEAAGESEGAEGGLSDAAAAAQNARTHDLTRSARQFIYSAAFSPVLHTWYGVLSGSPLPILGRLAVDQL